MSADNLHGKGFQVNNAAAYGYDIYHLVNRPASPTLRAALHRVADLNYTDIGDFGCGDGHIIQHLGTYGNHHRIYAIDLEENAIEKVNRIFANQRRYNGSDAKKGDITDPSSFGEISDGSLDAVFSWRVVHNFNPEKQEKHLAIVHSKLTDGGELHLAVLSDQDWKRKKLESRGLYQPDQLNECLDIMHFNQQDTPEKETCKLFFFSKERIYQLAEKTGFEVIHEPTLFQEPTGFPHLEKTGDTRDALIDYYYVGLRKRPLQEALVVAPPLRRQMRETVAV